MTHWGWYWKVKKKHTPKLMCSQLTCIDSFQTFKGKNITLFTLQQETIIGEIQNEKINITVTDGPLKGYDYKIPLEKQACNYGGFRSFFHCPKCNRRMRKLYCVAGVFLCRKCLHLGYYSQRIFPALRNAHMRDEVERKLETSGGSLHEKPKWMRQSTFKHLKNQYWKYEFKCEDAMEKEMFAMYGSLLS